MKYLLALIMLGCLIDTCVNCVRRRCALPDLNKSKVYFFKQLKAEGILILCGIIFWLLYM